MNMAQEEISKGKSIIGVDIGITSVNIAQMALVQGQRTLIKVAVEGIEFTNEQERPAAVIEALRRAVSQFNTQNAEAICIISDPKIIVDHVLMPIMPPQELAEAVKLEAGNSQHFPIENPVLDFQVMGHKVDKGVEKINVMVAAIAKSSLDEFLAKFVASKPSPLNNLKKLLRIHDFMGLNITRVIPLSIAVENIVKLSKLKFDEPIAALEMSSASTELNIYRENTLVFSRKINVTGLDFTRSLTGALFTDTGKIELTMQEAEQVKREHGIPLDGGDEYLIKDKITANQAFSLLRPRLEQLAREISRSFDYYHDSNDASKINKLVMFGGGTAIKRLPEFLNTELGLPVQLGNSLEDVNLLFEGVIEKSEDAGKLTLAIGAALGDSKGLNLMPLELRNTGHKFVERALVGVALILGVVISVFAYLGFLAQGAIVHQQASALNKQYQTMLPELQKLQDKLLFEKKVKNRLDMGGFLRQLSYLPSNTYLTQLTLEQGKLTLSGFITGNEQEATTALDDLTDDLAGTVMPNAKVVSSKRSNAPSGQGKTEFVIEHE